MRAIEGFRVTAAFVLNVAITAGAALALMFAGLDYWLALGVVVFFIGHPANRIATRLTGIDLCRRWFK